MKPIEFIDSSDYLVFSNNFITFKFNKADGSFDLINTVTNRVQLNGFFYEITFNLEGVTKTVSSQSDSDWDWGIEAVNDNIGKGKCLNLRQNSESFQILFKVILYNELANIFFQLILEDIPRNLIHLKELKLLVHTGRSPLHGTNSDLRILKNDWQSWSPILLVDLTFKETRSNLKVERRNKHSLERKPKKGQILSDFFTLLRNIHTNEQIFLGFITLADQLSQFKWSVKAKKQITRLEAICYCDSVLLEKGEQFHSEILMFSYQQGLAPLEEWSTLTGIVMKARKHTKIPVGWCSWYQYWKNIDEAKIYTNLEAAKQLKNQIPLEYFQIDDGYEPGNALGDWLETDPKKFPNGLKDLTQQISAADFKPGIWLAPFVVSTTSNLYKEHPDWFVRDKNGKLIWGTWPFLGSRSILQGLFNDRVLALDLTHPAAQDWLKQTIHALVKDIGFKYLKIDFIYAGAIEGIRHNPKVTRIQAFRKGIEIIREAAGENTFILGCGAPFGPCIGVVDAMRVSTDTAPSFKVPFILTFMNKFLFANLESIPSLENATQQNLLRYFFHKHLWINDPDTLIVRHTSNLSPDEIRFEVTVIGLLGGLLFISDNLANLTSEEIALVRLLIPPSGISAHPVDMLIHNYPEILVLDVETSFDKWKLAGVINWSDDPKSFRIHFDTLSDTHQGKYHVFEFWARQYLGIHEHSFKTEAINPHSAILLTIHEVKETPTLLSSTFHITQGGSEVTEFNFNAASRSLRIALAKKGESHGSLFLYLPPPYLHAEIEIEGEYIHKELVGTLLRIDLKFIDNTALNLLFK
ncbi:MAG: glycoside hydrolase family 36 protein [Candidatus Helarchaeota archaeon]